MSSELFSHREDSEMNPRIKYLQDIIDKVNMLKYLADSFATTSFYELSKTLQVVCHLQL